MPNASRAVLVSLLLLGLAAPASAEPGDEPIVVLPVAVDQAPLFPEELEGVRSAVRAFLEREGFEVAPASFTAAAEEAGAQGRARVGGPRCALPPEPDAAVDALVADEPTALVTAGYLCELRAFGTLGGPDELFGGVDCHFADAIEVALRDSAGVRTHWWRVEIDEPALPSAWTDAVAKLEPHQEAEVGALLGAIGGMGLGSNRFLRHRHVFAPGEVPDRGGGAAMIGLFGGLGDPDPEEAAAAKEAEALADREAARDVREEAALEPCFSGDSWHRVDAVLSVDASGKVTRCSAQSRPLAANAASVRACACRALTSLPYEPGAERRVVVGLHADDDLLAGLFADGPPRIEVDAEPKSSAGRELRHQIVSAGQGLEACLPGGRGKLRFRIRWSVDAGGHPVDVTVKAKGRDKKAAEACILARAEQARFSCTADGKPAVHELSGTIARSR